MRRCKQISKDPNENPTVSALTAVPKIHKQIQIHLPDTRTDTKLQIDRERGRKEGTERDGDRQSYCFWVFLLIPF